MPPLLTFLIPTFNRAASLTRTIMSVLDDAGSDTDIEIVVVDDGSSDETQASLTSLVAAGRIRSVVLPENRGVAAARNAGLNLARGTWIALLDSDNQMLPGAVTQLLTELRTVPSSVGIFWGNCQNRDGRTTTSHAVSGVVPGGWLVEGRFAGEHFSVVRTVLARKHHFAELGTRNECAACFWFPIALESDLFLSQSVFQFYETEGDDRITSLKSRRDSAPELVRCFEETLKRFGPLLRSRTPGIFWGLHGRIAFYKSVSGQWLPSVRSALVASRGWRAQPGNLVVLALCAGGPWLTRGVLRSRPM